MQDGTKISRPRGRPRRFDPDAALAQARAVFLRHGYDGATLDELAAAMGINRPSLYAAFGDKESLYLRVVEAFGREVGGGLREALASRPDLAGAIRAVYGAALDVYFADVAGPTGCLVMSTAVTAALDLPPARAIAQFVLDDLDAAFAARIAAAKAAGETAPDADPGTLAEIATGGLVSLAIRARAGQPRARLDAIADRMAHMVARAA
jgi:AcrR family transcriptional regulator